MVISFNNGEVIFIGQVNNMVRFFRNLAFIVPSRRLFFFYLL